MTQSELTKYRSQGYKFHIVGYSNIDCQTTPFDPRILKEVAFVIAYDERHSIYIAWNAFLHTHHFGTSCTLSIGKKAKRRIFVEDVNVQEEYDFILTKCTYKAINNGEHDYEKIVLFRKEFLDEFFQHYEECFEPNENEKDQGYNNKVVYASANIEKTRWINLSTELSNPERNRYSCTRAERDASFRKRVLESYGHKCAICRCEVVEILEAGHINSVEYSTDDQTDNGICLCANHHKMYDKNCIDIDFSTLEIKNCKDTVQEMAWYNEFYEKYEGKIIQGL